MINIIVLNIRSGFCTLTDYCTVLYCTVVYQTRDCYEATVHTAQNDIIVLAWKRESGAWQTRHAFGQVWRNSTYFAYIYQSLCMRKGNIQYGAYCYAPENGWSTVLYQVRLKSWRPYKWTSRTRTGRVTKRWYLANYSKLKRSVIRTRQGVKT